MIPIITTFGWVPDFARGFVRDIRPRWAFEEVGQPYAVHLIADAKTPEHRRVQPFGQVPTYQDDDVAIFESGAMVLRIAERAGQLIPADPAGRMQALQWLAAALNSVEPFIMTLFVNGVFESAAQWSNPDHAKAIGIVQSRLVDLDTALGDKTWLGGDAFTVGDLMMVCVLGTLRHTPALAATPRLAGYVARGEARPAHQSDGRPSGHLQLARKRNHVFPDRDPTRAGREQTEFHHRDGKDVRVFRRARRHP